jgi:hypothetical protein
VAAGAVAAVAVGTFAVLSASGAAGDDTILTPDDVADELIAAGPASTAGPTATAGPGPGATGPARQKIFETPGGTVTVVCRPRSTASPDPEVMGDLMQIAPAPRPGYRADLRRPDDGYHMPTAILEFESDTADDVRVDLRCVDAVPTATWTTERDDHGGDDGDDDNRGPGGGGGNGGDDNGGDNSGPGGGGNGGDDNSGPGGGDD